MTELVLVPDLKCECGAAVDVTEEGRCAACRAEDRGDGALLTHDSRGWVDWVETVPSMYGRAARVVEHRKPCECGCGMVEVPRLEETHPWADNFFAELLENGEPLTVAFRHEIDPASQRLLKTLGATYTISPDAPHCVRACALCNAIEQEREAAMEAEGRELLDRMDAGESVKVAAPVQANGAKPKRRRRVQWTKERIIEAIQAWAAEHGAPPFAYQWVGRSPDRPSKGTVANRFGTWSAGIEAAGFARPRPGPPRDPEPDPAPPASGDLRVAGLALIASVRTFLDALEAELQR